MAAAAMATAAGAAVILYIVLIRRLSASKGDEEIRDGEHSRSKRRVPRRPAQAPATWLEAMTTVSETLRFTYSETLGKWPIGDLAFGIKYLMRRQGNAQVASVYAGDEGVRLRGPEIIADLNQYLSLLTFCMLFSKKPFPVFLESAGFSGADVLLQKPKAGLLKPAFTILCDKSSRSFLLLIRGTHSIKDTLTAATGAVVPFHHSVLHDGGISNLVLGYAHCGMVAAARWIAKLSTPCLLKALDEYPDYKVKFSYACYTCIVSYDNAPHGMVRNWSAVILAAYASEALYPNLNAPAISTFYCRPFTGWRHCCIVDIYSSRAERVLFEHLCLICPSFAAACMTWDLAESGEHFVTTIINGSDLVPTFSTSSIDDLRTEVQFCHQVTASSWLNDMRDQIEHTRVLNVVYRSATALGSHLPRVAVAGALLQPVSSSTQVVMKRARNVAQAVVKTRSSLSSWSCIGARRRSVGPLSNPKEEDSPGAALIVERTSESLVTEVVTSDPTMTRAVTCGSGHGDDLDEEDMAESELWLELEKELNGDNFEANVTAKEEEEEAAAEKEITEEEKAFAHNALESKKPISSSDVSESHRFYPPGKIMHMVSMPISDTSDSGNDSSAEESVGIYKSPRELYSKLRLSRTMINDHYMPMYKRTMERLIRELEMDEACSFTT
ncbi:hypothetical protein RHGRI_012627 [Rhododendron griersonianum]|uniref:Mono-/di-acylglycerol lipase N-terminal domain-containing protein n=1 Tax=Rhododendron griersonianum TaxID=479676 RepID=A0AAV6KRD4_9ERIC|nr:hypothetical protein RHGRI_012627 [Rhododendron griersonianum]